MGNPISKKKAALLLKSEVTKEVLDTLLLITFNFKDWLWVQNECITLLNHPNLNIRELSITCLGHIARIHGIIEIDKVFKHFQGIEDKALEGRISDAIDDIQLFVNRDATK